MFDRFGYPTLEMRCPKCSKTQQIKLRNSHPHPTACLHCKNYLFVMPIVQAKPNALKLSLQIVAVDELKPEKIDYVAAQRQLAQIQRQAG